MGIPHWEWGRQDHARDLDCPPLCTPQSLPPAAARSSESPLPAVFNPDTLPHAHLGARRRGHSVACLTRDWSANGIVPIECAGLWLSPHISTPLRIYVPSAHAPTMTKGHSTSKHVSSAGHKVARRLHDKVMGAADPSSKRAQPQLLTGKKDL